MAHIAVVVLLRLASIPAHSQMSTDKEDATARYQNDTMGRTIDDWARHLEDRDPGRRLQALRLLGESIDPKAGAIAEALGKLATQRGTGSFGSAGSITTFSHSQPNPEASELAL
jgi:hypothetical protein